jgi:protein-tyrosine-phosphatase
MITTTLLNDPPAILKILAHDLRWKLIVTLTRSDYRVQELVSLLQQPQNLVSYHLKQLRNFHVVAERRSSVDARDIYYSLDLAQIQTLYTEVGNALHPVLTQPDADSASSLLTRSVRVLFLCTANSARSQMAEGILRHFGGSNIEVFSAGTTPAKAINPYAIRAAAELGIDISQQHPKSIDLFREQSFDTIITVCDRAREMCPHFPGDTERIHWSFADPAAVPGTERAKYQAFVQTAQQLTIRIRYLLILMARTHKESR